MNYMALFLDCFLFFIFYFISFFFYFLIFLICRSIKNLLQNVEYIFYILKLNLISFFGSVIIQPSTKIKVMITIKNDNDNNYLKPVSCFLYVP